MRRWILGSCSVLLPLVAVMAQPPTTVPPGTPVTITVKPGGPDTPAVSITLEPRQARATPHRQGCCHTGGGNIDVAQPAPDTVVITMTGAGVAVGSVCKPAVAAMDFDLQQAFE